MSFYPETLPQLTTSVLESIKDIADLQKFYLSGGTALSLQLGHRESEDLDFFTSEVFNPQRLQEKLLKYGNLRDVMIDDGTSIYL